MRTTLPAAFVDAMLGRPSTPVIRVQQREPTEAEIAAVDAVLAAEGIFLSRRSLVDVCMEETTGSACWFSGKK